MKNGTDKIPYVSIATSVNMAAGSDVAGNLKKVRELTNKYGVPIIHDMTRVAENAYFIKQREAGYEEVPVKDTVKEICSLTDGATMSAKKDALVNIGGFLALNKEELFRKVQNMWLQVSNGDSL